ncbi:MAG: hypothetical protein ACRD2T_12095 [Thermoanaerobaculia bacterium]
MARTAHRLLTYDDLLALPDDGLRHELIDGEHYVTPARGVLTTPLLPGLEIALAEIFA